jgi:hypothetical protein
MCVAVSNISDCPAQVSRVRSDDEVAQQFLSHLRPPSELSARAHAWSRQAGFHARPAGSIRHLLAQSQQAGAAQNGKGVIEYKPVGYTIVSEDFTEFFQMAHSNAHATGEQHQPSPMVHCSASVT